MRLFNYLTNILINFFLEEIIEFPCLAINSSNLQIEGKFHRFVKPKIHPQITSYCTQLTGITQVNYNIKYAKSKMGIFCKNVATYCRI